MKRTRILPRRSPENGWRVRASRKKPKNGDLANEARSIGRDPARQRGMPLVDMTDMAWIRVTTGASVRIASSSHRNIVSPKYSGNRRTEMRRIRRPPSASQKSSWPAPRWRWPSAAGQHVKAAEVHRRKNGRGRGQHEKPTHPCNQRAPQMHTCDSRSGSSKSVAPVVVIDDTIST